MRFLSCLTCVLFLFSFPARSLAESAPATKEKPQSTTDDPPQGPEGKAAPPTTAGKTGLIGVTPGLEVFAQYSLRRTSTLDGQAPWFHIFDAPLEQTGMASPADLGITGRFNFPKDYGFIAAGVYNGEGYTRRELNRGKNVEIAGSLHPAPSGAARPFGTFGSYVIGSSGTGAARAESTTEQPPTGETSSGSNSSSSASSASLSSSGQSSSGGTAKLVPGDYVLVVANVNNANPGPQGDCLNSGGPATCYQAAWGISGANGDQIFLLSSTDAVIDEAIYPANAVLDGQSYCRLPNGAGDFQACKPTPSELNAGP